MSKLELDSGGPSYGVSYLSITCRILEPRFGEKLKNGLE